MKKVIVLLALLIYSLHGSTHAMQIQDDDDDQFSLLPLPGMQEAEPSPQEQAAQATAAQEAVPPPEEQGPQASVTQAAEPPPEEQADQVAVAQEIEPTPQEQAAQTAIVQEAGPPPEEQAAQVAIAQEIEPTPQEQAAQTAVVQEAGPPPEEQAAQVAIVQEAEQYPQEQVTQTLPEAPAEPEAPTPVGPEIKPTQFTTLELEKSEKLIKSSNRKIYGLYEQASKVTKKIDEALNSLSIIQKNLYDDYYQATDSLDLFYQKTSFIKGQFGTKKRSVQ